MKHPMSLLALACALAACTQRGDAPAAAADAQPAGGDAPAENGPRASVASTQLTVYSGDYAALAQTGGDDEARQRLGYALVESKLRYALKTGSNLITVGRLPRALDVAAVALRPESPGVAVEAQRYMGAPGGATAMLQRSLGQRVAVEHTSGGAKQTDNGTLVAVGDGLTLALADGRTKVIREYDSFSLLDAAQQPAAEAQLRWQIGAQRGGDAGFALSYPTGGLAWRAEYLATLGPGTGCILSLEGAALVANQSGVAYPDVALTLIAGEPNRSREEIVVTGSRLQRYEASDAMQAAPAPVARVSGEYYAYPIPRKAALSDGAIERIPLFARLPAVKCERAYETRPEMGLWQPPQPLIEPGYNNQTGPQPVKTTVAFDNDKASGLGQPLPAGRVRVFDGADFLGESTLQHSPEGAELHLDVGTVFDLTAERERSAFRVDRAGRTMTESFVITLKNAKKTAATVRVVEPVPRWSDWDIVESSVPAKKRDAQQAEFDVPVPAGGETRLTYTARYRWGAGVRP